MRRALNAAAGAYQFPLCVNTIGTVPCFLGMEMSAAAPQIWAAASAERITSPIANHTVACDPICASRPEHEIDAGPGPDTHLVIRCLPLLTWFPQGSVRVRTYL
jgi:hypothetical protein